MDCYTLISKLAEHMSWPVAAIVIVLMLRKPIANAIEKLKKAKIQGSEFDFGSLPEQKTEKLEAGSVNIPIPTDTIGMQQEFEALIRRDLEAANISDPQELQNILVSHLAATQLTAAYERVNSSIFGSQIDLLRSLNSISGTAKESSLKLFYDSAKSKYPEFYEQASFEEYLNYLLGMNLIDKQTDEYNITKFGIGYLVYIAEKGLTGHRHF